MTGWVAEEWAIADS